MVRAFPIKPALRHRIVAAGAVSFLAWVLLEILSPLPAVRWTPEMTDAARRMQRATAALSRHCQAEGVTIDSSLDPNGTCLIGPEYTELFTTLGQVEAKRTTTSPDVAALIVHFFSRAGVSRGDTIAVGASGSFPALMVANLVAAEAMAVHPVVIPSLGASSYGATRPELDLLDIYEVLLREGAVVTPPAVVSLGGQGDVGGEFDPAFREGLRERVLARGTPLLEEPDLRRNVARRMEIYLDAGRIAAFVNTGGSDANLGTSPLVLDLPPGPVEDPTLPPEPQRGVLFEMASRGIPVIHLLNMRGLALRYGLPWDPVPLPEPGTTALRAGTGGRDATFWLIAAGYLVALAVIVMPGWHWRVHERG